MALLLRLKQPRFPVCFLTESAGPIKTPDPRRASLHHAIEWARAIHCWGIVTECWPVVHAPELVQMVCMLAASGYFVPQAKQGSHTVANIHEQVKLGNHLRLLTYGTANNDRNFVELQRYTCVTTTFVYN